MISRKYGIVLVLALAATVFQISVMKGLVRDRGFVFEERKPVSVGKFIRVKKSAEDPESNLFEAPARNQSPPDPPPGETPPEPENVETGEFDFDGAGLSEGGGLFGMSFSDGDYLPIVKVPADYPESALQRGIEGWVLVSFTVSKTGSVKNPTVVQAEPSGFFERAAIIAVKKFKYKPRIVGGEAVEVSGVRNRIVFRLEDAR